MGSKGKHEDSYGLRRALSVYQPDRQAAAADEDKPVNRRLCLTNTGFGTKVPVVGGT